MKAKLVASALPAKRNISNLQDRRGPKFFVKFRFSQCLTLKKNLTILQTQDIRFGGYSSVTANFAFILARCQQHVAAGRINFS